MYNHNTLVADTLNIPVRASLHYRQDQIMLRWL